MKVSIKFDPEEYKRFIEKQGFIFYETDNCYIWEKKTEKSQLVEHIKYFKDTKNILVSGYKLTESGYQEIPCEISFDILKTIVELLAIQGKGETNV